MSETSPKVSAVVLNHNRKEDTLACLRSLTAGSYANLSILVLDSACTDGSDEAIRAVFPQVRLLLLEKNLGYAGNNNIGIRAALADGADWVFVLNEDTLLAPDCVEKLLAAGQSGPRVGLVGPLVYHHDEPEIIQSAGGGLDGNWLSFHIGQNEPDCGQYSGRRAVDWITGCAMFVRAEMLAEIGLIEESFFLYDEETELAYRARQAGWEILVEPGAKLWHKGVQRNYQPPAYVAYYLTRNHLALLDRQHAPAHAKATYWLRTLRTILSYSLLPKWRHKLEYRDAFVQGLWDYVRGISGPRPLPGKNLTTTKKVAS